MEQFVKHYPGGYEELPSENTPVTAGVLDDIEQCLVDASGEIITSSAAITKLDNVTKYLTATATTNGDFKVNITNTLASGFIINVSFPAATNGASNARLSIDNGTNYKNIKDSDGNQLLASDVQNKKQLVYYDGTNMIIYVSNTLAGTSKTTPLSQYQGKLLYDLIVAIQNSMYMTGVGIPNNDCDNALSDGCYSYGDTTAHRPTGTNYGTIFVMVSSGLTGNNTNNWVNQIGMSTGDTVHFRQKINAGAWTAWKTFTKS